MAKRANKVMNALRDNAIQIVPGMKAKYPKTIGEKNIDVSGLVPQFNRCYAISNFTVCFVYDDEVFVTPYTREIVRELRLEGFIEKFFYVPFCYGDYPKGYETKWDTLRKNAEQSYLDTFVEDCTIYCDKHNIGKLTPKTMSNCFKIPNSGVKVRYNGEEILYYPMINSNYIDSIDMYRIGKYNVKNGLVVFVYRDGKTYVSKNRKIVEELDRKGYEVANLTVPFAMGEEILDPKLKEQWEQLTK